MDRTYIAIDLKSFYASVECRERELDPLRTNLVVADESRTEKTICLAVSPSLKSFGIASRPRLFEVVEKVKLINDERRRKAPYRRLPGSSWNYTELRKNPALAVDYIVAPPQMAKYIEVSRSIYNVYMKYISPEDIHVYSIDEVFIDVTYYLKTYNINAHDFAMKLILEVLDKTGITATCGIGTNMYLCKIAMDIMAKHMRADKNGVRIASLDEKSYRESLWNHRPLTDFWRVGHGYEKKLESHGIYTMGDIAKCSLGSCKDYWNEDLLYRLFGVNAELLIDHAWGCEPCTMADIKAYKPESSSISSGQVLHSPYEYDKAEMVVKEMAEALSYDLISKDLKTKQLVLTIGYDAENLTDPLRFENYTGAVKTDSYGRKIPVHAHGTVNLKKYTSSSKIICGGVLSLFESKVNRALLIRRINITACNVLKSSEAAAAEKYEQLSLFSDISENEEKTEKEKDIQSCVLSIKERFGKNSIIKCSNLMEGSTVIDRNSQIGGHRA